MKSIGKYQVIEGLGGGAAGNTYRVRDAFRAREFAVKVLKPIPAISATAKEQLCAKLAACAELTHRHIAKVQDLGEVEEGVFVATEWRLGKDLGLFMQENQSAALGQKLAVIAQVAEGLAFAHSRGIAHGNLKPRNILVDDARDVSILDFGSAQWLAALLATDSCPEGLVVSYLAPEQVLGQPFDGRSDIFALGLMLYEFATGKYPFTADAGLVPRDIVHSEPEPLGEQDLPVPRELVGLLTRALHKNPEQRLQTAEEFASELYVVAQQLRRLAALAAPSAPPPSEQAIHQPAASQIAAAPTPSVGAPSVQPAAQPVRQRPQDVSTEPQPWTARSYANTSPLTSDGPISSTQISRAPSSPPRATQPPLSQAPPPLSQAPSPSSQAPVIRRPAAPAPPALSARELLPSHPITSQLKTGVLIAAAGLIVAAVIAGSFISRQSLRASEKKNHPATAVAEAPAAAPQTAGVPNSVQASRISKPPQNGPGDLASPELSARETLNGPVRSLWESGRYAQALTLVNQVLAQDPADDNALAWKKKIREAQAAEAALK